MVSTRGRDFRNARARNAHVEATLNLSCPAQVPAAAAYGDNEVGKDGRTIRKRSPLDFEVHVVEVDGVACAAPGPPPRAALLEAFPPHRPQWLGRYALPGPSPEYRSF